MKIGSVLLVMLLGVGASVEAQSLGDMAQKEKEKRDAKAKEGSAQTAKPGGKATVFTAEDLAGYAEKTAPAAAGEGGEGGDVALPAPGSPVDDEKPRVTGSPDEPRSAPSEEALERARQEKLWRGRAESARAAIAAAEKELAAAQKAKDGIGIGPQTNDDEVMRAFANKVREAENRITRAQGGLASAKANLTRLEDAARREGALPGWLR